MEFEGIGAIWKTEKKEEGQNNFQISEIFYGFDTDHFSPIK